MVVGEVGVVDVEISDPAIEAELVDMIAVHQSRRATRNAKIKVQSFQYNQIRDRILLAQPIDLQQRSSLIALRVVYRVPTTRCTLSLSDVLQNPILILHRSAYSWQSSCRKIQRLLFLS